jgi:hypothetical protein
MSSLFRLSNTNPPSTEPEFTFQPPFASEYDEVSTLSIQPLKSYSQSADSHRRVADRRELMLGSEKETLRYRDHSISAE